MEQTEQFLRAAAGVGYATKPVQLFYALNQAGRAICAARAGDAWEFSGHGATVRLDATLEACTLTAGTRGALPTVATATGSQTWQGTVTLGALWASLPELDPKFDPTAIAPVPLEPDLYTAGGIDRPPAVALWLNHRFIDADEERRVVGELLAPYPRAVGWEITSGWIETTPSRPGGRVWLTWPTNAKSSVELLQARTECYDDRFFLRPGLGANSAVPSALVTWWGILLVLSQVARYDPVTWRRVLDIDASPQATLLESTLDLAAERVVELVADALTDD